MMRMCCVCAVWVLLAGCVYEVPLAKEGKDPIDTALLGRWETTDQDGQVQSLLVLPWNANEYLVHYPADAKDSLYLRAFAVKAGAEPLLQLQLLGAANGSLPDSKAVYHYASVRRRGTTQVEMRLLEPSVISKDLATPEALSQAIVAHRERPEMFGDAVVFVRAMPR